MSIKVDKRYGKSDTGKQLVIVGNEAEIGDLLFELQVVTKLLVRTKWQEPSQRTGIATLIAQWEALTGKNLYR